MEKNGQINKERKKKYECIYLFQASNQVTEK